MKVVDLFPDPIPVTVGGNIVEAPPTRFPTDLTTPDEAFAKATITPYVDASSVLFAPLETSDAVAALFLGVAVLFGPDFFLAPAGLVSDKGIRPGFELEKAFGSLITPNDQWLRDRREGLAGNAPLTVRFPVFVICIFGGLMLDRLLLVALESSSFVISAAICAAFGASLLEVIRKPLQTREERELSVKLNDEFLIFSAERLAVGGRCHESEIVSAFREYFPRYRRSDMSRTTDGVSVPDDQIGDLVRMWNRSMGGPGERTPRGFWKGISLAAVDAKD